jgi:hypothetical protein
MNQHDPRFSPVSGGAGRLEGAYDWGDCIVPWWSDSGRFEVNVDSVRLDPGAHRSPRDGVCLLELASLMARERFSDRPRCVCVVIAAFLRDWNDRAGHAQRQDLRPYARRVIGSRARRSATHRRRDVCLIWAGANLSGGWASRAMRRMAMRLRILAILGIRPALHLNEGAGQLAARVIFSRYDSEAGLRLVDELLEIGSDRHASGGGRGGDAFSRAVVEGALRYPGPLPGPTPNGNGNRNGNGNGSANGNGAAAPRERVPAAS